MDELSLRSLRAFEAVVRNRSITRAAAELGVSQPAISQRLRQLEEIAGRPLVRRTPQGLQVDGEAEAAAARIRQALDALAAAADALRAPPPEGALTVSLLATFAQRWLIPRLSRFQERWPEIEVRLLTTSRPAELQRGDVDLAILSGHGRWPGYRSHFLMANRIVLVASPALLARMPIRRPSDLAAQVLIRIDTPPRDRDWPRWLAAAGVQGLAPRRWLTFSTSTQALEAAVAGLGVAVSHTPFVEDAIASGHLVRPLQLAVPDADGDYYLVAPRGEGGRAVRAFRDWLLGELGGRLD
jgi:LysR family glycine cleavage system transcriptional activator